VANVVRAGDLGERLAVRAPRPCFLLLVTGELRGAAELHAARLCSGAPLSGAGAYKEGVDRERMVIARSDNHPVRDGPERGIAIPPVQVFAVEQGIVSFLVGGNRRQGQDEQKEDGLHDDVMNAMAYRIV
jgi:hypothetical protein